MAGKRLHIYIYFLLLITFGTGADIYAQTQQIESQKSKIKRLEQDISYLDGQIRTTQKQKQNTLDELVLIQRKITNRKKLLNELDIEIKNNTADIAKTENSIVTLERRLDTLEHYYRHLVYNAYKNRDAKVWFMYILASNSFEQGYRRWSYLKNYSKMINEQSEKIKQLKLEHNAELKKLTKLKSDNLAAHNSKELEYEKLSKEEKQSQAFAKSLDKKQNQYKTELAKKRKEAERLAKEVERLIAAEIKRQQEIAAQIKRQQELAAAKKAQDANTAQASQTQQSEKEDIAQMEFKEYDAINKLSGGFAINKGKLPFPVASGVIIEPFGEHPHPTLKNVKLPFNNGINISTKGGSEVRAVFDGVVKQVIAIPGYNQCVLMQHGQYFTFYCKLAKVSVKIGDKISLGQTIGTLENNNGTAVLHFELWNGTTKQNPELWLNKN